MGIPDPMVERIAARQREARLRAERLRGALPECVRRLRARGARRVVLFGSLATHAPPHEATDIDLLVEGLQPSALGDALFELQAIVGSSIDLVAAETASSGLLAVVARDGVELSNDVTG